MGEDALLPAPVRRGVDCRSDLAYLPLPVRTRLMRACCQVGRHCRDTHHVSREVGQS